MILLILDIANILFFIFIFFQLTLEIIAGIYLETVFKTKYSVRLFCEQFSISSPQEVISLKSTWIEWDFRHEEEYCRTEPGFTPQLWRPFCNEREPQCLCLQLGWGRAAVRLCAVINIRTASLPEASSHFYKVNAFLSVDM